MIKISYVFLATIIVLVPVMQSESWTLETSGNYSDACGENSSGPLLLPDSTTTSARSTLIVDISGKGDHLTIQDAIDNASLGAVIHVWSGTYHENIIVNFSLSLRGNGSVNTIIDGGELDNVVSIYADMVNISGFNLTNSARSNDTGIFSGVSMVGVGFNEISNCTFHDNEVGVHLLDSANNTLDNSYFQHNEQGVYVDKSDNNTLSNNTFRLNICHAIRVNGSFTNKIYHNIFDSNNNGSIQVYSGASTNRWYDTGNRGNLWYDFTSRYPDAHHDGEVWATPYDFAGSPMDQDLFPLVEKVLPELVLDNSKPTGTTGEFYHFNFTLYDNTFLDTVCVNWTRGDSVSVLFLQPGPNGIWLGTIDITHTPDILSYHVWMNDTSDNAFEGSPVWVPILDNDIPSLVLDNTSLLGTTGDPFYFNATVDDNIGVAEVLVEWTRGDVQNNLSLSRVNAGDWKNWSAHMDLDNNSLEPLEYYFVIRDDGGNVFQSVVTTSVVVDNDGPWFQVTPVGVQPTTGSTLILSVLAHDNVGISGVFLNHTFDGLVWTNVSMGVGNESGTWIEALQVPLVATHIEGYFHVLDTAGLFTTQAFNYTVLDDDVPVANAGSDITIMQFENVTFNATLSSDNIGVASYMWSFEYDGQLQILFGDASSFYFALSGIYNITLEVEDMAGNVAQDVFQLRVLVLDNESPFAVVSVDGHILAHGSSLGVLQGALVEFNAEGCKDNMEVTSYTWYLGDEIRSGPLVEFVFNKSDIFVITLNISDMAGNYDVLSFYLKVVVADVELGPFLDGQGVPAQGLTVTIVTLSVESTSTTDLMGLASFRNIFLPRDGDLLRVEQDGVVVYEGLYDTTATHFITSALEIQGGKGTGSSGILFLALALSVFVILSGFLLFFFIHNRSVEIVDQVIITPDEEVKWTQVVEHREDEIVLFPEGDQLWFESTAEEAIESITCSDCGIQVLSEAKRCPGCGTVFDENYELVDGEKQGEGKGENKEEGEGENKEEDKEEGKQGGNEKNSPELEDFELLISDFDLDE